MVSAYNLTHPVEAFRAVVNALPGESAAQARDKAIAADPAASTAQAAANPPPPVAPAPAQAAPVGAGANAQTISPEDAQSLINGNILPVLIPLLTHAVDAFNQGPPKRSDYPDDNSFFDAQDAWAGDGTAGNPGAFGTIVALSKQVNDAHNLSSGKLTLGDGTVITQDMINSPDPYVAAQARSAYENQSRSLINDFNTTMNKAGLDRYDIAHDAAVLENDNRTSEFNSNLSSYNAGLDYDKTAISRAADDVNRQLNGLQESRARADLATKTMMDAAPYATQDGKTAFSPSDFGALAVQAGQMAGLSPNDVALRYPTTVHVDPTALMQQGDAALGVQGALPLIPQMTTQANSQPTPQPLVPGPAPYNPVNPVPYQLPPTAGSMPLVQAEAGGGGPAAAIAKMMQDELFRQQQQQAAQQQGIFG